MVEIGEQLRTKVIAFRRDLHAHPETAWTEFRTTAKVVQELMALAYEVRLGADALERDARMGVPADELLEAAYRRALDEGAPAELLAQMQGGMTGCVAEMRNGQGPTVGLRVDIDALPVTESSDSSVHLPAREGFASRHHGLMHSCGHDGHTAMGIGVATLLAQLKDQWHGTVRLLFQPSEEGTRGAAAMVAKGHLDDVETLLSVHLGAQSHRSHEILPGVTGFLATAKLDADFEGCEAHAGLAPQDGKSALVAAALATVALTSIPRHSGGNSRVNVGVLRAGVGRNVVAPNAHIEFELRAEEQAVLEYLETQARNAVAGAAEMIDVIWQMKRAGYAPGTGSDPRLMDVVAEVAAQVPGVFVGAPCRAGASDDATAMMARVQQRGGLAAYVIVGSNLPSGHHTPRFDVDEEVLEGGVQVLTGTLLRYLAHA